jgi:hypothetical protein
MKYVYDQSELVANFVAQMIPHVRALGGFGRCSAIGITETIGGRDELVAGLVYHQFDPLAGLMEISGAALPGVQWATRRTLLVMHSYPFGLCKCQMVIMRVARDNERLLHQLLRLGYELTEFPRMFGREKDGAICRLTDDKWRAHKITKRLLRGQQQMDQQQQEKAA